MSIQPQQASYTVGGNLVSRERFYAIACDPSRSVVVEACAGAGKTWMLVSRILRALLEGARPQEIVAITFTRKAAGEMRERLTEWLAEFAACSAERRIEELVLRGIDARRAEELEPVLANLHAELLRGGRPVEIRTFHSWFGQLLRAAPLELLKEHGISAELSLIEEEADVAREVFQRFFVRVQADPKSRSVYQNLVQQRGRSAVQSWLDAAFDKRVEIALAHRNGTLLSSMPGAEAVNSAFAGLGHPLEAFDALRARLSALGAALGASKGAIPQKAGSGIEQGLSLTDRGGAFKRCYAELVNKDGAPRTRMGDNPEVPALAEELIQLARAIDQHEARELHLNMCHLALILLEEYESLKLSRGLVDNNDMERGALALLGDPIQAGWIQEKLDSQIRHLLVDEFQDTSPLQWHALHSWLEGYVGAGGGMTPPSVFVVGDPKQSIYRFRRAEPKVFAAAAEFVVQGLGGSVLACDHTRRNAPAVIDAVNQVFETATAGGAYSGFRAHTTEVSEVGSADGLFFLPDEDLDSDGAGAGTDATVWRPSLTVPRHEVEVHRREAEAKRVATAIQGMLSQGIKPGQIFVLARKRAALRALSAVLNRRGVSHIAPEDTALKDAPDVRDLIALLDVIASPANDLALAQALRSPLFGASDDDLVLLSKACGTVRRLTLGEQSVEAQTPGERRTWWRTLMELDETALSPALSRARALLAAWATRARDCSAHDLLDTIVQEGDLIARLTAAVPGGTLPVRLHAVQSLLCVALELDGGRNGGLYAFVRSLKNRALKLPAPTAADAVQLLTVHGAKGLEAKVVILMDTDAGKARAESSTLAVSWPVSRLHPAAVAFLASEANAPASLVPLLEEESEARAREEMNGLYVALTRARAQIIVSRSIGKQQSKSATWWTLLQPLAAEMALTESESAAPQAHGSVRLMGQIPPRPAAAPSLTDDPTRDPAIAAVGEALHRVLEWASGPAGASQSVEALVRSAAQMYGLHGQRAEQLATSAQAILDSAACKPFFDRGQVVWAGNEVPVEHGDADLRIDRLVCRQEAGQNVWWVLDYKLGSNPQDNQTYLRQMSGYVAAVKALQPGEPVRAAFITGRGELVEVAA